MSDSDYNTEDDVMIMDDTRRQSLSCRTSIADRPTYKRSRSEQLFVPEHPWVSSGNTRPATARKATTLHLPEAGIRYCWEHRAKRGSWHPFPMDVSAAVDAAYSEGQQAICVDINGLYQLDLESMMQCSVDDPSRTRMIRRIPIKKRVGNCSSENVKWEFRCSNSWRSYQEDHATLLESAYKNNQPMASICIFDEEYIVNFSTMKQCCATDQSRSRTVRRVEKDAELPSGAVLRSALLGVHVKRGPDWSWGDQDGGAGNVGMTCMESESPCHRGWVPVKWPNGFVSSYRVGHDDKYDLVIIVKSRGDFRFPDYWIAKSPDAPNLIKCPKEVQAQVQALFEATYSSTVTRDRQRRAGQNKVPKKYVVLSVSRVQNTALWGTYSKKMGRLQTDFDHNSARWQWPEVWTNRVLPEADSLESDCNEFYLFHGSPQAAAQGIIQNGIDLRKANDGLFGRMAYFAESITKADEYSPASEDSHTMLICRVMLGEVWFTDEDKPDKSIIARDLVSSKKFHSVLAQRRQSGYREFAIVDNALVYPEYFVVYRRQ